MPMLGAWSTRVAWRFPFGCPPADASGPREEACDCGGGLVQRVPQHRVASGDGDDFQQVAERVRVGLEQMVVRQVRPLTEDEQGREPNRGERRGWGGHLA